MHAQTADGETIRTAPAGGELAVRSGPRLLGAALEPLAGFRESPTRTSRLFVELDRRFPVVGFVRPTLTGWRDALLKLRAFHPDRESWRGRWSLSPAAFEGRTELAERQLADWAGAYDLIFQLQTVFAPGRRASERPYAIYTDNIYTMTERGYPAWAPLGRARDEWVELERRTCRDARVIFAMSTFLRDALVDDYGVDPDRVVVVGAGANTIAPSLEGKRYDAQVALFVGLKFEIKGGETLLEAWETVRRHLPEARLQIVGPKQDPGGGPGVEWLGVVDDWERLERLYSEASAFVLPAHFEPFGLVFPEAMGRGLPCIATDHCAMPEIVRDGTDGLLVPPHDAEALAEAIVALLGDPARAEAMGHAAYASVLERWTWRAVADRMAGPIEAAVAPS
jgi:glycosyltransferase involved in cell wall biosynthesis